jgi:hypothetical protein
VYGVIYYFAAGPHPRRLCLRGFRRSALLQSTIHLVTGSVSNFPPPVPSRLSPLGIVTVNDPLSDRLSLQLPAACAFAASSLDIASTDYPLSLQLEENLF